MNMYIVKIVIGNKKNHILCYYAGPIFSNNTQQIISKYVK